MALTDHRVLSYRRRRPVSLSAPSAGVVPAGVEPAEQLDRAVEVIHRANRALAAAVPERDELVALGGLLTQISGALGTITERLLTSVHRHDRGSAINNCPEGIRSQTAADLLRDCRNSYRAACASALALHAHLKH
jgi:hypothetical protein